MSHESIALHSASCTACDLCVKECPDDCISLTAHQENDGRKVVKVLDEFSIDFGKCMRCGICVDVCPFDALFWSASELPIGDEANSLNLSRGELEQFLGGATRPDGSNAPLPNDPPSGRRKR